MARNTIKLSGFKEAHDALGTFKKSTERALLRRVATRALEPFVERAKQLVPVNEGNLRDSISIGTKLTRGARREAKRDPVQGVRMFAGTANRNGVPREFGSVRSAPDPFMRPAWDSLKNSMAQSVLDDLGQEIERTAQRARKRSK